VIIADQRSAMVAAKFAATIACAFDFGVDLYPMLARRALFNGAPGAPLNSARSAWEKNPVKFGA
jgi:hypothetical protein